MLIKCPKCNNELEEFCFSVDKTRSTGRSSWCKKCKAVRARERNTKKTKQFIRNTEELIKSCKEKWGDKYDYSQTIYINKKEKFKYICPIHGEQNQTSKNHLKVGCPRCSIDITPNEEEFKLIYLSFDTKECCKYFNVKKSTIFNWAKLFNIKKNQKVTTESFINKVKNKYPLNDYSNTIYINKYEKIRYICPYHGMIEQYPYLHWKNGCFDCNGRGVGKHTYESFIKKANKIHGNGTYQYPFVEIESIHNKIKIICPKHGEFEQKASNHINLGNGCPSCAISNNESKGELEIKSFIESIYNDTITKDRTILDGKEIDIYLPKEKLGFEYHGLYWHREEIVGKKLHFQKLKIALKKDIRLIQIFENEWKHKNEIVCSKIKNLLGFSEKIYARKCKISLITSKEKNEFLEKNHLQGKDNSSVYYGLLFNNELVACMTFGKPRFNKEYDWELLRFCNKINYSVIGGASKLFKKFVKENSGSIISYANRRNSFGKIYETLGFKLNSTSSPGYFYYNKSNGNIFSRFKCQKHKLKNMPFYNENLSEYEIMKLNDYDRIWDAGQLVFVYEN